MTTVSGSGFDFSVDSTGGTWTWRTISRTLPGVGVFYEVHDIGTPWGPLYQAAIPIPAEVIVAIADSIVQIQQQLAPLLALVDPSQISFVIVITEGDPNQVAATIPFTNLGAFGSSLSVSATPSVPWLRADPGFLGGIGKNEQSSFSVTLVTGTLLESASPYLGVINLQDNRVPPTIIPIAFSITVLPRPTILVDPSAASFIWYQSTSSGTGPFTLTISNSGPANSTLNWTAARLLNTSPWLSFTPVSGGPLSSLASQSVQLSLVSGSIPTVVGTYTDTIRFLSPNASNGHFDVPVTLNVAP